MNAQCCLAAPRKARRSAPWLAPTAVLLLMPKCPMCLAAYVAAATGVSMSLSTAGWLRTTMITGSIAALLGLSVALVCRWFKGTKCACADTSRS